MAEERSYQLDSIRALGLFAVIFQHTVNPKGPIAADVPPLALTLFFVLSGFLITGILLDARARAEAQSVSRGGVLRRFYIRRFLRIFPLYYGVILVAVLLGEPSTRKYFFEMVTYQTNFLLAREGHNIAPITPFWSLSVEEHFYMAWPMIALFTSRRMMWASAVIMVIGSVVCRGYLAFHGAPYATITMPTYSALDGIAIGCILAIVYRDTTQTQREPWIQRALLYGGLLLLVRIGMMKLGGYNRVVNTLHTFPFALVSVWIVDRAARDMLPRFFSWRWLARIGVMTYAGYAVHRYVMHYLGYDYERGLHVFVPVLLISVLIANISWVCFESPLNNLKRFWPYVPRRAPVAVSAGAAPGLAAVSAPELVAPPDPVRK